MKAIRDTEKSRNIQVDIDGQLTLDEMESVLCGLGAELGLIMSHITRLSPRKYPGNRHWHFKEDLKSKGTLDVTYWPDGPLFWITCRRYEPAWVHKAGKDLSQLLRSD